MKTIISGGKIDHRELIFNKSDGEIFWCSISLKLLTLDDEKVLIAGFHDITEMKKTEEELMKHQEQLEEMVAERTGKLTISEQKLLQSVKDISDYKQALDESSAVTISNIDGVILHANDKFCELSKYSREEVIGKRHTILDANFHPDEFFNVLWGTVAKGEIWRGEINNKAKDGSYYWVDTTIIPFLDQNGKPYQNVAVKFDITNRKSIEADLIKAKQTADAANRAKSEFLANMSHEILTPMNAVIGFSELLTNSDLDEKQRSQVESIHSSGKNLLKIINDILDLSKIEAGKIDILAVPIHLSGILSEIENIFAEKAKENRNILTIDYENLPKKTLLLDEVRCRQILFNLVGNALKFTQEGRVCVSITYRKSSENDNQIDLTLLVKDTGIGIPADQQEYIFDPFKQPSGQNIYKYGGTGLGLSITKKLVEKMGGSISLKSEVGKGSTFRIDLPNIPFLEANIAVKLNTFDPSTVLFKPATVLITDDNQENLKLIIDLLEYSPLTILQAENGKQAVDIAKRHLPDLILMDLRMPVMNGYEATKILRKLELTKAIPIIAITASILNSNQKEKENIEKLFDQYLLKPLDIEQFIEMLKKYLNYELVGGAQGKRHTFSIGKREYKLSYELKQKLPEFIKTLELEFLPEYKKAIKKQVINEIEQFSINLLKISEEINCDILIDYSKELNVHVENFDFEKLIQSLKKFPELVDWLKVETDS